MTDLLLDAWAAVMWKACWQGSLVVLAVWLICLRHPVNARKVPVLALAAGDLEVHGRPSAANPGQSAAASCPSGCQPHARGCRSDRQAASSSQANRTS